MLSALDHPWQTYEYLTRVSQIPRGERLRSDSASRPDNIWGFPSYGFVEGFKNPQDLVAVCSPSRSSPTTTPRRPARPSAAMEREASRIRYNDMLAKGLVRIVRRRYGGGYFSILTPPEGVAGTKRVAFRSRYVHVAVGYPGLKFLPELQAYRTETRTTTTSSTPTRRTSTSTSG